MRYLSGAIGRAPAPVNANALYSSGRSSSKSIRLKLPSWAVRDNGTEIAMAHRAEPGSAAATLRYYAEAADKIYGAVAPTEPGRLGMVVREPVGVCRRYHSVEFSTHDWYVESRSRTGLRQLSHSQAATERPACRGCASPSWRLMRGVPAGVFSVITGTGSCTGRALSRHGDVDIIAFTGGATVGRGLLKDAADTNIKRVYLELGGKSPHVVFADTRQFDASVQAAVKGIFRNAGQVCIAGSRLLVEEDIAADYLSAVVAQAEKLVVGDPLDLRTDVGAVCGDVQLATGPTNGRRRRRRWRHAVLRWPARQRAKRGGTYMEPTVYSNVSPDSRLAKEEVFWSGASGHDFCRRGRGHPTGQQHLLRTVSWFVDRGSLPRSPRGRSNSVWCSARKLLRRRTRDHAPRRREAVRQWLR